MDAAREYKKITDKNPDPLIYSMIVRIELTRLTPQGKEIIINLCQSILNFENVKHFAYAYYVMAESACAMADLQTYNYLEMAQDATANISKAFDYLDKAKQFKQTIAQDTLYPSADDNAYEELEKKVLEVKWKVADALNNLQKSERAQTNSCSLQ